MTSVGRPERGATWWETGAFSEYAQAAADRESIRGKVEWGGVDAPSAKDALGLRKRFLVFSDL